MNTSASEVRLPPATQQRLRESLNKDMSGALRGVPAKGVGAYLPANSAVGGVAPS